MAHTEHKGVNMQRVWQVSPPGDPRCELVMPSMPSTVDPHMEHCCALMSAYYTQMYTRMYIYIRMRVYLFICLFI